jgi:hypothetical protein
MGWMTSVSRRYIIGANLDAGSYMFGVVGMGCLPAFAGEAGV